MTETVLFPWCIFNKADHHSHPHPLMRRLAIINNASHHQPTIQYHCPTRCDHIGVVRGAWRFALICVFSFPTPHENISRGCLPLSPMLWFIICVALMCVIIERTTLGKWNMAFPTLKQCQLKACKYHFTLLKSISGQLLITSQIWSEPIFFHVLW